MLSLYLNIKKKRKIVKKELKITSLILRMPEVLKKRLHELANVKSCGNLNAMINFIVSEYVENFNKEK